ncbi:MAG: MerR family transcriptional regulator [Cyclobacteriaceae bacterium]|nr:MerR family transcriptional regulator [Cyclobacteriaceae bacterium]
MSVYSIKDLEQLSGIKAHTLRIWEQRYNFIKPKRTDTNIRFYDDADLKLVLNISLLKENGHKISKICDMSFSEMQEEVVRITEKKLSYPEQIQALTLAMIDMDEDRFEKIMSINILQLGFERTMINIIYPFFLKIGVLWQTGAVNPAQEHFISNLVRQKLIVAIDGQLVSSSEYNKKYMLYLPENEIHEIGLLFSSFIIKARNNKVIYLGQNLPFEDLSSVYGSHKPDVIVSVFTSNPAASNVQDYIDKLGKRFPSSTILISGHQVVGQGLECPKNVIILNKLQDLIDYVDDQNGGKKV